MSQRNIRLMISDVKSIHLARLALKVAEAFLTAPTDDLNSAKDMRISSAVLSIFTV